MQIDSMNTMPKPLALAAAERFLRRAAVALVASKMPICPRAPSHVSSRPYDSIDTCSRVAAAYAFWGSKKDAAPAPAEPRRCSPTRKARVLHPRQLRKASSLCPSRLLPRAGRPTSTSTSLAESGVSRARASVKAAWSPAWTEFSDSTRLDLKAELSLAVGVDAVSAATPSSHSAEANACWCCTAD